MSQQQSTVEAAEPAKTLDMSGHQATQQTLAKRKGFVNTQTAPWIAGILWVLIIALTALALLLQYVNGTTDVLIQLLFVPAFLSFPTIGALIVSRRPDHPIGWMFLAVGLTMFGIFSEQYAIYALVTQPGSLPGGLLVGAVGSVANNVGFYLAFTFLLLLFPDGKLPSRRWRPIAWFTAAFLIIYSVAPLFMPGPIDIIPTIQNPLGIEQLAGLIQVLSAVQTPLIILILVAGVTAVTIRFRRGSSDTREQLKWVLFAIALLLLVFIITGVAQELWGVFDNPDINVIPSALFALSIIAFPISVGIAILRYRLYDIDLIINRTLVYVPLTGILAGLYSATVALFQKLFTGITGETSDAAIVISTLILASLFTPLKNALQSLVDKRFKEAPHHTKELKAFGEQVRLMGQVIDLDAQHVSRKLLDKAVSIFHAQGGAVYLGKDGRLELVHTTGAWNGREDGEGETSNGANDGMNVCLESDGEQLGFISLGAHENGRAYTKHDLEVLQQVADQVAQVIKEDLSYAPTRSE